MSDASGPNERHATPMHDPYAPLRHPDVRRLLGGSMLATIGHEMQAVAVGWELYERTGSALALGLVGLVLVLPVVLFALPAGQAADRWSRKGIVLAAQATMGVASLGLALTSALHAPVWLVYVCLALAGTATAFYRPASWSLLPQLLPPAEFAGAVAWRSSGMQIATVLGPALGGFGIAAWRSASPVYVADALIGVAVLLMLAPVHPGPARKVVEPVTLDSLLAGVRFVRSTRPILATITLDMFAVLLGGATALLPIFARDILRVGPAGLGWLRAAPSLGAMAMAVTLAHRPPLRRAGRAMLLSVAGFGVATIVFGLSRHAALSFLALLIAGALDNISVVVRGTLVQVLTPDPMRGRVSAVNGVFIGLSNELGGFESGVTAALLGPVGSVVLGGFGCILVVLGVASRWPEIWRLGTLSRVREHAPETVPGPDTATAPSLEVAP